MKKYLIIGVILIGMCLCLTISTEINKNVNYTNIHDITNSGSKLEGVYVSLDTTYVAGSITGNDKYSYHVMFGDGVQYIVYMKNSEASKIRNFLLDNPTTSYKIYGITKIIPKSLEENGKKFVKEWLDNNHTHDEKEENHTHEITTEEFYQYFGYVYFDSTIYENTINKIVIYVTGILGVLCVLNYINKKYHLL